MFTDINAVYEDIATAIESGDNAIREEFNLEAIANACYTYENGGFVMRDMDEEEFWAIVFENQLCEVDLNEDGEETTLEVYIPSDDEFDAEAIEKALKEAGCEIIQINEEKGRVFTNRVKI